MGLHRFACHQHANRAEQDDVERTDDHVDLTDRAQKTEQERAESGSDDTSGHHDHPHAIIDTAAPAMRQHAGDTRAGDLRRCRCSRHGRWDAIEDQQGSGQEPAAHTEQSGKNARQSSQRDDPQSIYGQVRDWEIDIHALALSQRGDGWKPDYVRTRSKASERHHFPALHCQQHARGSLLPDEQARPRRRD